MLPEGLRWWYVPIYGGPLFPLYGATGSLQCSCMAVLIHTLTAQSRGVDFGRGYHTSQYGKWFAIEFAYDTSQEDATMQIQAAISRLV